MKKTTLLATVLTVLFVSQATAAPQAYPPTLLAPSVSTVDTDTVFSSSSDELRAFRNWKKETDTKKIEKEYRKWKREHSGNSDQYYRDWKKQQEDNEYKEYKKWKKKNSNSKKTFKEWNLDKETKDFDKWIKKHRKDWRKWHRKGHFENTDGGDGDGGGSGGAE